MKQGRAGLTALAATSLPWDSRGRVIFSHGQDRADIEDGSAPRLSQDASRLPRHAVEQGLDLRIQTPMPCLPPLTTPSVDCDPEGERCGELESTALGKGEWKRHPCLWEQQGEVVWLLAQPGKIKHPLCPFSLGGQGEVAGTGPAGATWASRRSTVSPVLHRRLGSTAFQSIGSKQGPRHWGGV